MSRSYTKKRYREHTSEVKKNLKILIQEKKEDTRNNFAINL